MIHLSWHYSYCITFSWNSVVVLACLLTGTAPQSHYDVIDDSVCYNFLVVFFSLVLKTGVRVFLFLHRVYFLYIYACWGCMCVKSKKRIDGWSVVRRHLADDVRWKRQESWVGFYTDTDIILTFKNSIRVFWHVTCQTMQLHPRACERESYGQGGKKRRERERERERERARKRCSVLHSVEKEAPHKPPDKNLCIYLRM